MEKRQRETTPAVGKRSIVSDLPGVWPKLGRQSLCRPASEEVEAGVISWSVDWRKNTAHPDRAGPRRGIDAGRLRLDRDPA